MPLRRGLVQVYTGEDSPAAMAAAGQALRAVGQGLKVCVVQFPRAGPGDGDLQPMIDHPQVVFKPSSYRGPILADEMLPKQRELAQQAIEQATEVVTSGEYDLVILADVNSAVHRGMMEIDSLLSLLEAKPDCVELILTGACASPAVISRADLVTEMREIRQTQAGASAERRPLDRARTRPVAHHQGRP
jgi:cob(I)alamin adenosyltransferase